VLRIFLLFVLVIVSCNNNQENTFIISQNGNKFDSKLIKNKGEMLYGFYNFILLNDDNILIHKKHKYYNEDEITADDTLTPFLKLKPNDFEWLQSKFLVNYILKVPDSIFVNGRKMKNYVIIASESDTVKNKHFTELRDQLVKHNINYFYIRTMTEEERVVLKYKTENKPYSSSQIKWITNFRVDFIPPHEVN
jgi:hypothetical protein